MNTAPNLPLRIFIGFDPRETVAYHVLAHSIMRRASIPVTIAPLALSQLGFIFHRARNGLQSTDFSFTRFLTPYLSGYAGWSLFLDCDMLVLDDIANLYRQRDEACAVMCVQHDHRPRESIKFLGAPQTPYAKKNWSSVMLFNNARCGGLTPHYVNNASGLELHQFQWLTGEHEIGALPDRWNHLVAYDPPRRDAALVHYTLGGPYFDDTRKCEYAAEWFAERDDMLQAAGKKVI